MAVIKTEHYEFGMSTLDRVKRWQFDALDDLLYELEVEVLTWTKLLDEGKPYYAAIDPIVGEDDFKNLLDVAFEKIGYYKTAKLSYKFEMGKHKRIATITVKGEEDEDVYEVKYALQDFGVRSVLIYGCSMDDVENKFNKIFKKDKALIIRIERLMDKN